MQNPTPDSLCCNLDVDYLKYPAVPWQLLRLETPSDSETPRFECAELWCLLAEAVFQLPGQNLVALLSQTAQLAQFHLELRQFALDVEQQSPLLTAGCCCCSRTGQGHTWHWPVVELKIQLACLTGKIMLQSCQSCRLVMTSGQAPEWRMIGCSQACPAHAQTMDGSTSFVDDLEGIQWSTK